jgi:DNA modification methylase
MEQVRLLKGNNLDLLKTLEDNSIDSIVSDPPYGLSFMNKKWDYDVPSVELWKEVLRVLKPGGHVLSFGGTRTYHRMVVNMEDAGFEIRDSISYMYGSGFPKSHNIGKAVDKLSGNEREVVGIKEQTGAKFKEWSNDPNETRWHNQGFNKIDGKEFDITKGNSEWEGWGTALKPSMELICLARKPLTEKSIAENVLKHGTGGINIDECRIPFDMTDTNPATNPLYRQENNYKMPEPGQESNGAVSFTSSKNEISTEGRFPANTILECICDEPRTNPECPCYILDKQSKGSSRFFYTAKVSKKERNMGLDGFEDKKSGSYHFRQDASLDGKTTQPNKNTHPTVKPINLMTYLCRLITPKGGVVLDMYMGSGSTGISALLEGFNFVGMEMDEDYFNIAEARINNYEQYRQFKK